jgi:hypothetical protein
MKNVTYLCFLAFLLATKAVAQTEDEPTSFTYAEFKIGYGVSAFGENLKEKYEAGNFSSSGGFLASLAAYHKFKKINYLNFGIKYKSLGAFPSTAANGDEMFFNYWGAAATVKFFPFDKNARKGLYLHGDFFFITQFTQKYRNVAKLEFNHQFALGQGVAFGLGYDIALNKKKTMLTIGAEYQADRRRGEVQGVGIGVKYYNSSSIGVLAGIKF